MHISTTLDPIQTLQILNEMIDEVYIAVSSLWVAEFQLQFHTLACRFKVQYFCSNFGRLKVTITSSCPRNIIEPCNKPLSCFSFTCSDKQWSFCGFSSYYIRRVFFSLNAGIRLFSYSNFAHRIHPRLFVTEWKKKFIIRDLCVWSENGNLQPAFPRTLRIIFDEPVCFACSRNRGPKGQRAVPPVLQVERHHQPGQPQALLRGGVPELRQISPGPTTPNSIFILFALGKENHWYAWGQEVNEP